MVHNLGGERSLRDNLLGQALGYTFPLPGRMLLQTKVPMVVVLHCYNLAHKLTTSPKLNGLRITRRDHTHLDSHYLHSATVNIGKQSKDSTSDATEPHGDSAGQ